MLVETDIAIGIAVFLTVAIFWLLLCLRGFFKSK